MELELIKEFVEKFVRFYEVVRLQNVKIENNKFFATADYDDVFDDDNLVDFYWEIIYNEIEIRDLIQLMDYLLQNHLFEFDRILLSDQDFEKIFFSKNWSSTTLKNLIKVKMPMIENNKTVGCFYLHK